MGTRVPASGTERKCSRANRLPTSRSALFPTGPRPPSSDGSEGKGTGGLQVTWSREDSL